MNEDKKIFKLDKVDFGVNIKKLSSVSPFSSPALKKKTQIFSTIFKSIRSGFRKFIHFFKFFGNELTKRKKTLSRSIFLGRGIYFKYISNLALLVIILFGAFVYLSYDKNDPKGFLSKYSGITSANSGIYLNTGSQAFITEKQFTITQYTVKPGDSVSTIAAQFSTKDNVITPDSIFWANNLTSRDVLKPGMVLDIPPVSGVIHTVKKGDTVQSIAKKYKLIDDKTKEEESNGVIQQIIDINILDISTELAANGAEVKVPRIVEGQRIIVPSGIIEAPVPVKTATKSSTKAPTSPVYTNPVQVQGANFAWPVENGAGYISQGYRVFHTAIDIAGRGSSPNVVAMSSGTVTFAGRGGDSLCGITVQITYDSGFSSIYCHMASVDSSIAGSLRSGIQPRVAAGQVVGRMGQTGLAFGIHVHLVLKYKGSIVNPCGYKPFSGRDACR